MILADNARKEQEVESLKSVLKQNGLAPSDIQEGGDEEDDVILSTKTKIPLEDQCMKYHAKIGIRATHIEDYKYKNEEDYLNQEPAKQDTE